MTKKIEKRKFFATAIGSVPHKNAKEITAKILKNFTEIPFWPQLPKRSFLENMYTQYIEGFPGVVIDDVNSTLHINTSGDFMKELELSYQKVLDGNQESFSMSKDRAEGFYEFLDLLEKNCPETLSFAKGHITGPISFGLSVTDEKKKPIFYNNELSELLPKILALKAKWQIKEIKKASENVIIFIDEPYLVSIGSSFVSLKKEDVVEKIKEVVDAVHDSSALAGAHCCGNTDWALLLATGIDILNFDAYNFMESVSLYPNEIKKFLERGGYIAWGIVPTSKEVGNINADILVKKLEEGMDLLEKKGVSKEKLLDGAIITPSCGCGTLDPKEAEKVFDLTVKVSNLLRKKYPQP